ncbi:hypothetical protein BCV70DRAFT_198243 [Testicularia cyperi]|uniref:Polysaccharide lyase family 14 protein n=1 Tax=Testicularia cyperi TaxID=1882483 RepID=A0A317XUK1_9BASI|nr:hypothetical protein BCV70DRAFT_198243 [Testicularia cyperi]
MTPLPRRPRVTYMGVVTVILYLIASAATTHASPASLAANDLQASSGAVLAERQGSSIQQDCVRRYNTSRMNPLPEAGYWNPLNGTNGSNGSMLTIWKDGSGTPGEPINAIISANSSEDVLCPEGFLRYATSINFGVSCFGNTNGTEQWANLGDGFGDRMQGNYGGGNGVLRWNYGDLTFGTCRESIEGDNHFRWFLQNGSDAFSGAVFLAVSMEESAALGHKIQLDGYNRGRDYLVGNATRNATTTYEGYVYKTTVTYIEAGVLLNATSENINHPDVALPGQPVQDGRVALLTVTKISDPSTQAAATNAAFSASPSPVFVQAASFALFVVMATSLVFAL